MHPYLQQPQQQPSPEKQIQRQEEEAKFLNAFDAVVDELSIIYWKDLPKNETYEFEFVAMNHAQNHKCRYPNTTYTKFIFLSKHDREEPPISKDEMMLVDIPTTTMMNAMRQLPMKFKRLFSPKVLGEDNLIIKFIKTKQNEIKIKKIERIQITKEQREKAVIYYEMVS